MLFLTKSDCVDEILKLNHGEQSIISFSVNSEKVFQELEHRTASPESRLTAAKKVQQAGYEVRLRIDPVILYSTWEKDYSELVDKIFQFVRPTRITIGEYRPSNGLANHIGLRFPNSPLLRINKGLVKEGGKLRYPEDQRVRMFRAIVEKIRKNDPTVDISLCKEPFPIWKAVGLTVLYWSIGKRVGQEILKGERAEYGETIVSTLSRQLAQDYGSGFSAKNLRHMIKFAEAFPDEQIVSTLSRQLSWSHFKEIIYLKQSLQREFYTEICRMERWSVRVLRKKIDSMLYERTAISRKPEDLVKQELAELRNGETMSQDLVFRDPYVLDFLNLKDTYSEHDLEAAILREIESFLLELGYGFTFVARQKRMIIDSEDFYLDLLFYHRNRLEMHNKELGL